MRTSTRPLDVDKLYAELGIMIETARFSQIHAGCTLLIDSRLGVANYYCRVFYNGYHSWQYVAWVAGSEGGGASAGVCSAGEGDANYVINTWPGES